MTRRDLSPLAGNLALMTGAAGVLVVIVTALFGPQLAPHDPQAQRVIVFFAGDDFAVPPTPPSATYPLGTDPIGRDILSRLLWGARLTLAATSLAVLGRAALGIGFGFVAGWRRGLVDALTQYAANALGGFPQLMLAILLVAALKDVGLLGFVVALVAVGWSELAQFVRAEVIRLRAAPYLDSARAIGCGARRVFTNHMLRNLAPQLIGLVALEAGSVLILLAELGFIGFFIGGGTFYTDDTGRPILPVRERAPEWGQMLAGARGYAYVHQWVAFVPALVVASAVFAFNLLAEGVRDAIDPRSPRRVRPHVLGAAWRGTQALALVGVLGLAAVTVRSTTVSFDGALTAARAAASRELPGGDLIAAVVRYSSDVHALARPEKINFYFRRPSEVTLLRVGFVDANPDAMEVKHFDLEDDLDWEALRPLEAWSLSFEQALVSGERRGGLDFRNTSVRYRVRVLLEEREGWPGPVWRVQYGSPSSPRPSQDILLEARMGSPRIPLELYLADAEARARTAISGSVRLVGVTGTWVVNRAASGDVSGTPNGITLTFTSEGEPGRSSTVLSYTVQQGLMPIVRPVTLPVERLAPLPRSQDLIDAYRLVDSSGGRAITEEAERQGKAWQVNLSLFVQGDRAIADASYATFDSGPFRNFRPAATFRADLDAGRVELLSPPTPR